MEWRLAEAKNRLSELVTRVGTEGPQTIRRHNSAVVVISEEAYQKLIGKKPDFKDWLLNGPRLDDLDIPDRKASPMRDIEF